MNIQEKLAALRAARESQALTQTQTVSTVSTVQSEIPAPAPIVPSVTQVLPVSSPTLFTESASKTQDINHLEFLSKMNALQEAIHTQHPTMPVLLFQIHTQLREDPEIVTLLNEEAIGVIVKGLEIQTKTELITTVVKQSKAKDKKTPLTLDML